MLRKSKSKGLIFVILNLFISAVIAQPTAPKSTVIGPKSPNVAAMERYGNYEVNLFHGVPTIDIPIFEIKSKNISVPITLSYHASGIKVTDVASWVGLGWSLNTGGAVSRTVKGKQDEQGFLSTGFQFKGPDDINPRTLDGYTYLNRMNNGALDTQPDIFSFSFNGKFGNFLYQNQTSDPIMIPYQPIKINRSIDPQYSGLFNFRVADEFGSNYVFGRSLAGEDSKETSVTEQGGNSIANISSWLLTDIVSADLSDTVSFKYNNAENVALSSGQTDIVTVTDNVFRISGANDCGPSSVINGTPYSAFSVGQKLMKEIVFGNGKIEFVLSSTNRTDLTAKYLDRINIYTKTKNNYQLLRTVNFFYSYFTGYSASKLKLDSVSVKSVDNKLVQTYRLDYQNQTAIPDLNSKAKDYWGYFNNRSNTTLVPLQTINYTAGATATTIQIGGADRNANPDVVQNGILKRIQFPTGGFTVFDYEPNKYSNGSGDSQIGGGVRVKAIYSFAKEGSEPVVKSYMYGTAASPESGLGLLNSVRSLSTSVKSSGIYNYEAISSTLYLTCTSTSRVFSANPTIALNDYDDTNVCYPFVTEYTGTKGVNIGKQTYSYSWVNDLPITPAVDDRPEVQTLHWRRGKLLEEKQYEAIDNTNYKLKRQVNNVYEVINPSTILNAGILVSQIAYLSGATEPMYYDGIQPMPFSFKFYDLKTGAYQMTSSVVKTFDSAIAQESSNFYGFNSNIQPVVVTKSQSNGDQLISRYRYANDYGNVNPINDGAGIAKLMEINAVAVPVEQISSILPVGGYEKVISARLKSFYPTKPLIKDEYFAEITEPLGGYPYSSIDGSGNLTVSPVMTKRLSYTSFDESNNVTGVTLLPGKNTSYIWGYKKSLVIAEVENASANEIAYSSFEEQGKGNWTYSETAVKQPADNGFTGKYVYDFAASAQISKNGLPAKQYTVSYWSNKPCTVNNLAPSIVGQANAQGWILYTHYLSPATGTITITSNDAVIDELKLYPSLANMKTYTHLPSIGVTDVVDIRNEVNSFEYDGLQKLANVKDYNNHIKQNYTYYNTNSIKLNTVPIFYYNQRVTRDFTKSTCAPDKYGTVVTYVVPEGSYYSTVSTAEAQSLAEADLIANGQQYANLNGECKSNDEVVWEPIGLYCQIDNTGNLTEPTTGYSLTVANAGNTPDYTTVTISRSNFTYTSKVNFEIYFMNSNNGKISSSTVLAAGETTKSVTIGTYPYTNEFRNGGSIVSIETSNKYYTTGYSVYAQRQKKVGGQIVLVEPNLRGVGQGPYFDVIKPEFAGNLGCKTGFVGESPSRAAYANALANYEFFKNNCSAGQTGSREIYSVDAGKYTSSISQDDANAKAKAEADANGQNNANLKGTCMSIRIAIAPSN